MKCVKAAACALTCFVSVVVVSLPYLKDCAKERFPFSFFKFCAVLGRRQGGT